MPGDLPKPSAETVTQRRWRVALVDDERKIREAWAGLIQDFPDFSCACACPSAEEALRVIPAAEPDIILMDILLPRISGIECTARLKVLLPDTPIIVLTALADDEMIFMALEAGADGYLLKRTKPSELRAALLDALAGGSPMTSQIARRVVRFFSQRAKEKNKSASLSAREEEVLILLSRGYANKEIAEKLGLSVGTVCSYLKRIYEKMHVHSRMEAVARYFPSRTP